MLAPLLDFELRLPAEPQWGQLIGEVMVAHTH